MYYLCSKNKGAEQMRGSSAADLPLCFRIHAKIRFSHDAARVRKLLGNAAEFMYAEWHLLFTLCFIVIVLICEIVGKTYSNFISIELFC